MKKVDLDFAARGPRRALYAAHPAALAACVAGVLLCAAAGVAGYRMMAQQRALDAQLRQAQAAQQPEGRAATATPLTAIPEAQAKAVNGAILQLNLPWRDMQAAVAAATPPAVALLSLEPDPRKQVLKVSAEAKNADDMIAYIEQLKQQEFFSAAVLVRHEIAETDPNRPLRFQLEVTWRAP